MNTEKHHKPSPEGISPDLQVNAWNEKIIIPTYGIGKPEKNPIFLEKRVYQGSSGVVYPHPVIEKILDEKIDKEWNAIFIENQYLKIMILPELGGRIQMAYDKIKQRHFIYYNQVIKPALVGLTGPWISGGLEFNWPQHHRPSTYQPISSNIETNSDGSVTVWCSEVERMFRTKGMAGFTLYPDKAFLEIKVKLYNRTAQPQTFLWWANPAVKVNDDYQSVFPPDVHAVYDHGRRDVSSFPIATGTYYKVDYSAGVDISRYKNIPVPTSYMAVESKYNFVGGYENDSKGGLLHVANHHVSPGKKQWTWGHGDFGQAWDRNLTDEDGPYIELMCGVYTDNQPDFSWLMPYEERDFKQYFMPYRDLGMVKNATKDAMVNLEFHDDKALVKAFCSSVYKEVTVKLETKDKVLLHDIVDFSPAMSFEKQIGIESGCKPENFTLSLRTSTGKLLVEYKPEKPEIKPVPEPAKAAKEPHEISSMEQLYLSGIHLEQYRHATYKPTDYYLEALRREPGDSRCNNAMGLWLIRHAKFEEALPYFEKAIETLTDRNPNPYDGEAFFNMGQCLRFLGKNEDAYNKFYKATWNAAWQDSAYFNLAQLASIKSEWVEALELVDHSLVRNWHNHKARHLKVSILRKMNHTQEALQLVDESLKMDAFNLGILYEKYVLLNNKKILDSLIGLANNNIHDFIEFSLDYAQAGLYVEAQQLLQIGIEHAKEVSPMAWYFMGWYAIQAPYSFQNIISTPFASACFDRGMQADPTNCFPNRLEEVIALQCAIKVNHMDAKAQYYLGNFWYNARQYDEALYCWEMSRDLDGNYPTVRRNLALAYYNKSNEPQKALVELETAFALDTTDARILMELDQLYKKMNRSHSERLCLLEKQLDCVEYRDDLYLEKATLHNQLGLHEKALELLITRNFHPWEGGEGKVTGQFLYAHIELAKKAFQVHDYDLAINHLKATESYPHNLGEGKLTGTRENDIHFWLGCIYETKRDLKNANAYWEKATQGSTEPNAAIFYNDQHPDKIFYQGLALMKLNRNDDAADRFNRLKTYGENHMNDHIKVDYFAVSLPDLLIWDEDLDKRNGINSSYLLGLGLLGLGQKEQARMQLEKVLEMDINHQGAITHLQLEI